MNNTKEIEVEEGMTGIEAIEKLLEIKVSQAEDISVVTIPMKDSKKDEPFLVLMKDEEGIFIYLNAVLAFIGNVSIIPTVKTQSKKVDNYVS